MLLNRCAPALALALSATLTMYGCGDGPPRQSTIAVRDSAGVTIVENDRSGGWPDGDAWRLSDAPVLDIGGFEGDQVYQFYDVRGALRLNDRGIVVANAGTHELRFYAADGSYVRSVGRQGDGPGEFRQIRGLDRLSGDTLAVWDSQAMRLSFFSPEGHLTGSISPAPAHLGTGLLHYGTFDDGSFVLSSVLSDNILFGGAGLRRDTKTYVRFDGIDGALLDTIAVTPGREVLLQPSGDLISVSMVPFGRDSHMAVHGDQAYLGVSDSFEILVIDREAKVRRIIRLHEGVTPITDSDVRRYAEGNASSRLPPADRDDPSAVSRMVQTMVEQPRPETFPAFATLVVDDLGVLWVREWERPGSDDPVHWLVFDAGGRLLGTVQMPRGFQVFHIGTDFVIGRIRDELDVEHVRVYALRRSGITMACSGCEAWHDWHIPDATLRTTETKAR